MSFTWFADKPLRTREQVAAEVHQVSLARGLDELATVLTCMGIDIEVGADDKDGNPQWWCPANPTNWPDSMKFDHDSLSNDSRSSGYLQQQPGPHGEPWWGTTENMMTLAQAANTFQDRLADDYHKAAGNAHVAGQLVQAVQDSEFPDRYQEAWDTANAVVARALAASPPPPKPPPPKPPPPAPVVATSSSPRPDFNEYPLWSPNHQPRNGTPIDLWLWHTEEGHFGDPNAADDLASGELHNPAAQVSYHRTASQAPDGGVTVCDVVDLTQASWSVLSANNRSIDFCIAGSSVNWSRQQWMANSKVIDVGCYLSVRDHLRFPSLLFNGAPRVIAPDVNNTNLYHLDPPGISDHKYVTQYLHDGSHSDMGPNFPWDYVIARTAYWWSVLTATAPPVTPPTGGILVTANPYHSATAPDGGNYAALAYSQLTGPLDPTTGYPTKGWGQLDGMFVVDYLAALNKKVDGIAAAHLTPAVQLAVKSGGQSGTEQPKAAKRTKGGS